MSQNGYLEQYQKVKISTASREMLLLMLYDGAIRFIHLAKAGIREGDMAGKRASVSSAIAVISELLDSLNIEIGGETAENLQRLYLYMNEQLIKANLKNDPSLLDEVLSLLATIREGWNDAISNQKSGQGSDRKEMAVGAK
ncbi:MAG: flagellar export chaperone FliS [Nitrospirota bacterium]